MSSYTVDGTTKYYDDLKSAIDAANADSAKGNTGGVVKLLKDYNHKTERDGEGNDDKKNISEYDSSLVMRGIYIFDLNGKQLSATYNVWSGGSTFYVESGTISLVNSDPENPGKITAENGCSRGIQICKDAHLEIGGSKEDLTLKSHEIQIYGSMFAVGFFDEGTDDAVSNAYTLTATTNAVVSFVSGTNTLSSGQYWFNSALRIMRGTCEILGGTNTFTINGGTKAAGNTCSISDGGTLRIAGGTNTINAVYDKTYGGKAYTIGLVWSNQKDVDGSGTLKIEGGTTILNGGKGNKLLGILPDNAVSGKDMVVSLVDAHGNSQYFQTSEGGEIQKATVDGIKDLHYATLELGTEITFNGNGGKTADEKTTYTQGVFLNQETTLHTNVFTRDHYTFEGWKDGTQTYSDGASITLTESDIESGPKTLRADWKPESWSVVLKPNGGTIASGKDVTDYTYKTAVDLPTAEDITRRGYSFVGWFDNEACTGTPVTSIVSGTYGDKTYYAKWEAGSYNVIFDANGADEGSDMSSAKLFHDKKEALPKNTYVRIGYSFCGWNTKADGTGKTYADQEEVVNLTEDSAITLYATWNKAIYHLTYKLKGGTVAKVNPDTYTFDEDLTINNPTRDGYLFTGWTESDSDEPVMDYRTKGKTGDKTLTANWKIIVPEKIYYKVAFDTNGGSVISSQTVEEGGTAVKPQNPTKSGYTFDKWMLGGKEYSFASKVTGNITLKASWTEVEKNDPQPQDPDKDDPQPQGPDNNDPQNQDHDPEDLGPTEPIGDFADVPQGKFYTIPVKWAFENGITTGTSRTRFSPAASCTRGQVMTFLYRAAKGSATPIDRFIDVPANKFYAAPVAWAVANEITTGTGTNTFSPDLTATRAQIVTFIWKAKGSPAASGDAFFSDVPDGMWYTDAIKWAATNGITSGIGNGKFGTDQPCTRGQVVTFLYRAYNN